MGLDGVKKFCMGRCYAQCKFSLMKNGFRWCEKVLHGGDVTQNHEKSIQRLSLNGKVPSLFRSKLICFLHNVFLRKFSRRIENYVYISLHDLKSWKICLRLTIFL